VFSVKRNLESNEVLVARQTKEKALRAHRGNSGAYPSLFRIRSRKKVVIRRGETLPGQREDSKLMDSSSEAKSQEFDQGVPRLHRGDHHTRSVQ